jgi:hypothetical protein
MIWIAYGICVYTPIDRISRPAYLWLLAYAGEWAYREEIT